MRLLIFATICAVMLWCRFGATQGENEPAHIAYTKHFLRHYPKRLERALELMPIVEGHAAINAVPVLAVVVIISAESSWKTGAFNPDKKERGLMQVHGQCAKGFDLSTPEGQIAAGTKCFATAYESCDGTLRQALTAYQSGSCKPRTTKTKQRIARRMRVINKWSR